MARPGDRPTCSPLDSSSTRTWGCPPLHIDNIASLLKPWSKNIFPTRDLVGLRCPLNLPSLPAEADCGPYRVFPVPPSDSEVHHFSDGSKTGKKVYRRRLCPPSPTRPTTRSHLRIHSPDSTTAPPTLPAQLDHQLPPTLSPMAHVCI